MQGPVSKTVQETNLERAETYCPESVVLGRQAHGFPAQGLAQVDHLSLPLDLSVGAYPSHRRPGCVLWGVHPPGKGSYRRAVPASWRLLVQRFMGPLLVVAGTKVLEGTLLPLPVQAGADWLSLPSGFGGVAPIARFVPDVRVRYVLEGSPA